MVFNTITFQHPSTNQCKRAPLGFSWTTCFFNVFVPLMRGDYKWMFIMLLTALPTAGLSGFVFAFKYNKFYIQDLLKEGYLVKSFERPVMSEATVCLTMGVSEIPYLTPDTKKHASPASNIAIGEKLAL